MVETMIDLPMTPSQCLSQVIVPSLQLLPSMDSDKARVMLLAIALQESGLKTRQQYVGGPAHGLWQMEKSGGIQGVFTLKSTRNSAIDVCKSLNVDPSPEAVYGSILQDDALACCMARLILWADVHALPEIGDTDGAWRCYIGNWRPGKPRPVDFPNNYLLAKEAMQI